MKPVPFVSYPPTSFPFRDLLVFEQLPLHEGHRICEVGIGSGGTTARLARSCAEVVGLEISAPTVEALRYLEERHPNLRLRVGDITKPECLAGLEGSFDELVSCDTLEHVDDAAGYFRGIASLLRPGGRFLVTFPNEPEATMHGVTRFDSPHELLRLTEAAGLTLHLLASARLRPPAERIAQALGWGPVELVRRALPRPAGEGEGAAPEVAPASEPSPPSSRRSRPPQTFDETRFFKRLATWQRLSPAVNLYWHGVLRAMAATGPCFELDAGFTTVPFGDGQVVLLGERAAAPGV